MTQHRRRFAVLLSCEHGGNRIPARYQPLFASSAAQRALQSHRGWDPGSLRIARRLQQILDVPLVRSTTSRLLIELNRSLDHPQLFSEWSGQLAETERKALVNRCYAPYRARVMAALSSAHAAGHRVLHLSLHTFTPVWEGRVRTTDIGLLFDPGRVAEADVCGAWQQTLQEALPQLSIHRNRPYRGTSDGLTTSLRKRFAPSAYLGIELEVSQRFFTGQATGAAAMIRALAHSLQRVIQIIPPI